MKQRSSLKSHLISNSPLCLALSYSNREVLVSTSAFAGRNSDGDGNEEHIRLPSTINFEFPATTAATTIALEERRFRARRESGASIGVLFCHECSP